MTRKLTYKQLEASRETRLWISQIIVPAMLFGSTLLGIPEVRQAIKVKTSEISDFIRSKFQKSS